MCVATYGKSKSFPAFFSRQSGYTSPYHVTNSEEAAALIGKMTIVTAYAKLFSYNDRCLVA